MPPPAAKTSLPALGSRVRVAAVLLFTAFVFALRLLLVYRYSVDLPYSDQWDSEAWSWFRPFQTGGINWPILFAPHNEHRIALYRIYALALFVLNDRQWDNLVLCCANALLVAVMAACGLRAVWRHAPHEAPTLSFFLLAACCLPCGFENLLVGFQAAFYFLLGLSVLGIGAAATRRVDWTYAIVLGLIGAASLFTMASGLFTPVIMAATIVARRWTQGERWMPYLPALAVLGATSIFGVHLLVPVEAHRVLHAQSIGEWFAALRILASWPMPGSWFAVVIFWLPPLLAAASLVRNRVADAPRLVAVAIATWSAAQIATLAFGRGHGLEAVASRYTDALVLGVVANAYCCVRLYFDASIHRPAAAWPKFAAGAWMVCIVAGYAYAGAVGFVGMTNFAEMRAHEVANVRKYLFRTDTEALAKAPPWDLPYPDIARLKMMLDDPIVRDMLPPGVRLPLPLAQQGSGFVPNGVPAGFDDPHLIPPPLGSFAADNGGKAAKAEFRVDATSRFPYLKFPVSGDLGESGLTLELVASDGAMARAVAPSRPPGARWIDVTTSPPTTRFGVHARDDRQDAWFAFGAPIESGRLSLLTEWLLARSTLLVIVTALAGACWLALRGLARRAGATSGR